MNLFRIIRWWYPQSASKIFKVLDKLALPKLETTTEESYLELPEDQTDFPIEVSESDEDAETSDEDNNALDSDENEYS